ncbi:MAG: minichromosome maintenance protein MCM [Candidatus Aenigmatarchaeota archaeon]|nr:minichromosome maintenance protein MCM [Candidatus Aenigmarchaeota archaeon]
MESREILDEFVDFLRTNYYRELADVFSKGERSIFIDFALIDKYKPDLADLLLEKPEDTLKLFEAAVEQIDLPEKRSIKIRLFNLPKSAEIRIRNIRSEHLGKLLCVDGIVKRASEIRPEVSEIVFQCGECGEKIVVLQTEKEKTLVYPSMCDNCKSKRGFKVLDQKLYDARWVAIEEPFEITTGERPSEIMIYLKEDLTSPKMQSKTDPGNRIKVIGILKELPRRTSKGGKTRQMEILLDANNVESTQIEWEELVISEEEEAQIKELAKDPKIYDKLVSSLAPSMYGLDVVKLAIVMQFFGGVPKILKDGTRIRGDIHILLVGDPAVGKSQLLKLASQMMPRGKYVSGKGVTGAGLTAAVVKDEQFLGGWVLEAGALVLANNSIIAIDEFDKMEKSDQVAMHEAMSLQQISIAKASIVATLPARTSVLAGANPKLSRFDQYKPIGEQVDIPETLLSRFDVKFALRDIPNPEVDEKMIDHLLMSRHFNEEEMMPLINSDLLKKYVAYAKMHCNPIMTKEAAKKLKDFYIEMRSKSSISGEVQAVAITMRQYEALVRLAEASARVQLREFVTPEDADRAIEIMKFSLRQFGFDEKTGTFDIDKAEGGVSSAQRSKIKIVTDIIEELEREMQSKSIPIDDLRKRAQEQGVGDVDNIIRKMKEEGIVFEPKHGFIQRI